MNKPQVTVLVAVWNTEDYLPQCLDSMCRQTLRDIQVVCVDDASTDHSLDVLQRYAAIDDRIEVVALPRNHGQAHARNVGLRQAKGDFICFLDSDDWMADDCLERAVDVFRAHKKTGCVLFDTLYYYNRSRMEPFPMPAFDVLSGKEAFVLSLTWRIHGVYMVRADIHKRYPYDESAHAFSDDNTTRLHYYASEEVRSCAGVYYYRQRSTSVSHQFSLRSFDYLSANLSMKRQLERLHMKDDVQNIYENHRWLNVVDMFMMWFIHGRELTDGERRKALSLVRDSWKTIDVWRLKPAIRFKFGYMPFAGHWHLFLLQEQVYFRMRRLLGRL